MSNPGNAMRLSAGVNYAWQIAADEAMRLRHEEIEPPDLLLGICSVGKLFATGAREMLSASEAELAEARAEWEELAAVLRVADMSAADLRRNIRAQLTSGSLHGVKREKISRSAATLGVFKAAEEIAGTNAGTPVRLVDLLSALLRSDDVVCVLERAGMPVEKFRVARLSAAPSAEVDVSQTTLGHGTGDSVFGKSTIPASETVVTATLDATVAAFPAPKGQVQTENRAMMFSELPWQLASGGIDAALQNTLERLMAVIPAAKRGAILLSGKSGQMLLKAHMPAGAPAVSLTLVERAISTRSGFVWQRSEDPTLSQAESRSESGIYAPLIWNDETFGAICVDNSDTVAAFVPDDLKLVVTVSHQLALLIANDQLTSRLRRNASLLERLLTNFSPKTRNLLLAKAEQGKLRLGGERSEVTVLCSDMRGFTRLAATMDAEQVVEMLNHYLSVLVGCVFRNGGTIDKFMGDAILAVFGSPEPDPQQHANGLQAALAMQEAIAVLNQERSMRGDVVCEIGVGVHCGTVLHGFIGTNERMEFTVIGDAVNKTSRYCAAAKAGEIIISPELHQHVWKMAHADSISIPTKHEGDLPAYRVRGSRGRA
jgi:class 3 adenylate cyclase